MTTTNAPKPKTDLKTDLEIANSVPLLPINDIAEKVGLKSSDLIHYGEYKAKIKYDTLQKYVNDPSRPNGKLILVTAMTPTPMGEGKTTVSIGLTQGLQKAGKRSIVALREPSLGPCFGMKGGAAGGGYSQVIPMEDINLHFTGDIHAVGTAHNLISAMLDNHLYHNVSATRALSLRHIYWKRVVDMNDRALRQMVIGLGKNGLTRESGFDITASSEIMAILCLSQSYQELKEKIGNILLGLDLEKMAPFFVRDLKIEGAATTLLKDALLPNLVQTLEHGPALIHGGPFANIAQGANTILATKMGLKLADYTVTEAGFGSDLGAEKFFDIVSPYGGLSPSVVVLVATCRALKYHSGLSKDEIVGKSNPKAIELGSANLLKHVENANKFNLPVIVAINEFLGDSQEELEMVAKICEKNGINYSLVKGWSDGGEGALDLAHKVILQATTQKTPFKFKSLYDWNESVEKKINCIAKDIYGAKDVYFLPKAKEDLALIYKHGFDKLPICMAKTQNSLSDNPKLLGRPKDFTVSIREIIISSGAGFLVPITGEMMRMPGLPKTPSAMSIDIDGDGHISGLF